MTYTRDQIMAMAAEELREAIALATGAQWWSIHPMPDGEYECMMPDKDGDMPVLEYPDGSGVPDWSNDIAAAWELVEEISQGDIDFSLYVNNQYLSDGRYKALFCEKSGRKTWGADSETATLAISRAWLLWKAGAA